MGEKPFDRPELPEFAPGAGGSPEEANRSPKESPSEQELRGDETVEPVAQGKQDASERLWARLIAEREPAFAASGWRATLAPGGLRLMAREMRVRERIRPEAVEVPDKVGQADREQIPPESLAERVALVIEFVVLRVARLIVLRIAGLTASRQKRVAQRQQHA